MGGSTLNLVSKFLSFSSLKNKLFIETLQVTFILFFFASFINSTDSLVDIHGMWSFPPVYSSSFKSLFSMISSDKDGIPSRP